MDDDTTTDDTITDESDDEGTESESGERGSTSLRRPSAEVIRERARVTSIQRLGRSMGIDSAVIERMVGDGYPVSAARALMLDMAAAPDPLDMPSSIGMFGTRARGRVASGDDDFRSAAVDALLLRAGIPVEKPHAAAGDLSPAVIDIARSCLTRSGKGGGWLSGRKGRNPEIVIRSAMSTSDFPLILADAMHKSVRQGYEAEPASHRLWVRTSTVPDFREQNRVILGSAPALEQVEEGGEYENGSLNEDAAKFSVAKYGKIVSLTWEALVNDDLGAFLRIKPALGMAARRKEADVVYALFALNSGAGPTMQDGTALFHANHANLASAGSFDADLLAAGRLLLRKQTALGGGYMALVPRYLIIPAELETEADMLLAAATRLSTEMGPREMDASAPKWISQLIPVVEPRLPANAVYLAADASQIDHAELAFLEDNANGPTIEDDDEASRFRRDIFSWKVRHVFGAKFLDWRGIVKMPVS